MKHTCIWRISTVRHFHDNETFRTSVSYDTFHDKHVFARIFELGFENVPKIFGIVSVFCHLNGADLSLLSLEYFSLKYTKYQKSPVTQTRNVTTRFTTSMSCDILQQLRLSGDFPLRRLAYRFPSGRDRRAARANTTWSSSLEPRFRSEGPWWE